MANYFIPPVVYEAFPTDDPFFARVKNNRGLAVLISGGVATESQYFGQDDINAADYFYAGGHASPLSDAEVALLTSLGYADCITTDPNPPSTYFQTRGR